MAGINATISKMDRLDLKKVVSDSLHKISPQLLGAQKEQLLRGQNAVDGTIGKYKSQKYKAKKLVLNPLAGGKVDLKLTGTLHREIKLYFFSSSFFFRSTDPKANDVLGRYGGEEMVMGLNKKFTKKVSYQFLTPEAIREIKRQLL